jgi:superfamily II DNA/RNA helicase
MPAESSAAPEYDPATFAALGVPALLVEVLDEQGITAPFPVQAATLPDALAGRDILGRARTGSGKTLGFSLPLVSRLAGGATLPARPRGLVLVPTRELATQVSTVLKPLARAMGLWVTTVYGGVSYGPQVNALQRRTDIVVATPGRLADLIGQGECDLADVEVTVIDEADQMADLGFLPIVRRLLETTPDDGQRMLFSATLDAAVDVLARRFLHGPVLHSVDENSSPAEIEHHVLTVEAAGRLAVIAALVGGEKRSLVFTRTKHGAERLARQLTEAGIPAAELHGNLRQGARSRNLAAFVSGLARVMVATDIAARGIHIDGIDLVIHADPPVEHKAYVHRSGRTARGGADGVVVTLQTRAQARDVTAMTRKAGITPHPAIVVDADSPVLTEIAGPPAARIAVSGKVAELVRAEDRLATNDRPGVGKPWEGRQDRNGRGRDRNSGRGRDRKPRGDRFRDRGAREFAPRDPEGTGQATDSAAAVRPESAARRERTERPERGERPVRFERENRPSRGERSERAPRFDRDSPPGRDERAERGGRRADNQGAGSRGTGGRDPGGRGFGDRNYGDRPNQRGNQGGNDWRPRSGGGSSRPGSAWRPYSADSHAPRDDRNRDNRGRDGGYGHDRGFGGDRQFRDSGPSRGTSSFRDDRPVGDERSGREERPFRGGRPQADGQSRQRPGRGDRPQSGGNFDGSSRRSGYSAGRGAAGKRRDSGQGRHF